MGLFIMQIKHCTTFVVCGIIINVRGITLKDMIKQGDKTMKVITKANMVMFYKGSKFVARYDVETKRVIYSDLYTVNELLDFLNYLNDHKYSIEGIIAW